VQKPKTLVLVLAVDKDPWTEIELEGQDKTWKLCKPGSISVMRYVSKNKRNSLYYMSKTLWAIKKLQTIKFRKDSNSNSYRKAWNQYLNKKKPEVSVTKDTLTVDLPEAYSLIGLKTCAVFGYVLNHYDFDFLYRTNISSYIDLVKLESFVDTLHAQREFYGGVIGHLNEFEFASGSGYLISRESLSRVVENFSKWNHFEIDDVALGIIMSKVLMTEPKPIKRKDFISASFAAVDESTFHYRCKAKDPQETIAIMKALHEKINSGA